MNDFKLKRNLYLEWIFDYLNEKYLIFFKNAIISVINHEYQYYEIKDETLKNKVKYIFDKKLFKYNDKFKLTEYIFIKLLSEMNNLEYISETFFNKLYSFFGSNPNDEKLSDELRTWKDFLMTLNDKLDKFYFRILSVEEINNDIPVYSTYLDYINICRIHVHFYKYCELITFQEFAEKVNYDCRLLVLYCEVMIYFSNTTKEKLIHYILNLYKIHPLTNPGLIQILIILGFTYEDTINFNQEAFYFKFEPYKLSLKEFYGELIHINDFDEFSFIHTVIYAISKRNDTKLVLIQQQLPQIYTNLNLYLYMINIFKDNLNFKILGPTRYVMTDNSKLIELIIENLLNAYFYLDDNYFRLVSTIVDETKQKSFCYKDFRKDNNSYSIEFGFNDVKKLLLRIVFEKSSDFHRCIVFYLKYISYIIKSQKISSVNFLFDVSRYKKHYFSSELIFFLSYTSFNLNVDLYNILLKDGELCNHLTHFLNCAKYSSYSKRIVPNNLIISISTQSIEKIIINLGERMKLLDNLIKFDFLFFEFNIIINSDNGFEILEVIINELIGKMTKNEIIISIKLYEENTVFLKVNKTKNNCFIYYPSNKEVNSTLNDLICYLFSFVYNVINPNNFLIDMKISEYLPFSDELNTLFLYQKLSLNFFNSKENVCFLQKLSRLNNKVIFKELELIYYPFTESYTLINILGRSRIEKLFLNLVLNENESSINQMKELANCIKFLFKLSINFMKISIMISDKSIYDDLRTIIIKSFENDKYIECLVILNENNLDYYLDINKYFNWEMKKLSRFELKPTDLLNKTIVKMKKSFYSLLYCASSKQVARRLKRGPILTRIHEFLYKKVYLIGELVQI